MKTKLNNIIPLMIFLFLSVLACNKKEEISDLDKLRKNTNKKTYPTTKMDSTQAISKITEQKIQELLDLSSLYTSGNGDTEIDSVIYAQMQSYFSKPDSNKISKILKPFDSFKASSARINNLIVSKKIIKKDTIDFANFNIEYFDKNKRSISKTAQNAHFVLKLNPVKFKKEFKFYIEDFDISLPKDSISVGVTK